MALTTASMASDIQTQIEAIWGAPVDADKLQEFCTALATAIVNNIKTNAVIPAGIAVQVNIGSGTGATTAPGTVT